MSEPSISIKRIIGAAFFGFAAGDLFSKGTDWAIVGIVSRSQHINTEMAAARVYESLFASPVRFIFATAFMVLFGASIAGFLGRRKGVLCGLLSGSPWILLSVSVTGLTRSIGQANNSTSLVLLWLTTLITAASIGGLLGQRLYSPGRDLDKGKNRLTVFGVYWVHYFWLLPIIFTSFVTSFAVILYATVLNFLTDFYFAWHPSLWFKLKWLGYSIGTPIELCFALFLATGGFVYFLAVMQHDKYQGRKWSRFWRASLSGLGAPALACGLALTEIEVTSNLPRATPGDWKIALALIVFFGIVSLSVRWMLFRSGDQEREKISMKLQEPEGQIDELDSFLD